MARVRLALVSADRRCAPRTARCWWSARGRRRAGRLGDRLRSSFVLTEGWEKVAPTASIDVSPPSDDRPFVAQMGLWRNFDLSKLGARAELSELNGWPLSQSILLVVLLAVG